MFGCTAKEWRDANPERAKIGENIRDSASINELNVLANAETHNAEMITEGVGKKERFEKLKHIASRQLTALDKRDFMKSIKKTSPEVYLDSQKNSDGK
ncbi:MAG: hypothetical protein ABW189_06920 [Rickettsiales bacterium]